VSILACCDGKLDDINLEWSNEKSLCIVVCSNGYPEKYKKNVEINNLNKIKFDHSNLLFHAGTKFENDKIKAVGGRVLNFVSLSDDFGHARKKIIESLSKLNWSGGFFRKDIGYKVID